MMTEPWGFLASILLLTASVIYGYRFLPSFVTRWVPAVVVLYVVMMVLGQTALWQPTPAIEAVRNRTVANLLPAMLFLMMLGFRLEAFLSLGWRLVGSFFLATASLFSAFIVSFWIFAPDASSLAALSGSWTGGTANMLAVASVLKLPPSQLGSVIAVDTLLYALWLMLLLGLVSAAPRFNRWTQAKTVMPSVNDACPLTTQPPRYIAIILLSVSVAFIVNTVALTLPQLSFAGSTFYSIVLATLLGVTLSFTPLRAWQGTKTVADNMLFLIIAVLASSAKIDNLEGAGWLLAAGAAVLGMHAALMVALAKLFRLDLFSIAVASLSHIGGMASAPLLASAYHPTLIPVAVAMATMGYLMGTVVGLSVAAMLHF